MLSSLGLARWRSTGLGEALLWSASRTTRSEPDHQVTPAQCPGYLTRYLCALGRLGSAPFVQRIAKHWFPPASLGAFPIPEVHQALWHALPRELPRFDWKPTSVIRPFAATPEQRLLRVDVPLPRDAVSNGQQGAPTRCLRFVRFPWVAYPLEPVLFVTLTTSVMRAVPRATPPVQQSSVLTHPR
jgi:hypothetical protein